jgi:probable F420-dependent oxidoreductase
VTDGLARSITLSGVGRLYGEDLRGLVELARMADDLGIDQLVITDHLAIGPNTDRYPYGRFPLPQDEPWPEPLTTLAAMAGATCRLRLGTGILIAPLRSPLLLAKTTATLDVLSGGRLDLGVGVGWQREEFDASGIPWKERWRRLDDTLRACRALWHDDPAAFESRTVTFEEIRCLPHPAQEYGIPVWFGVSASERNVERMVELGAGWMPMTTDLAELRAGVNRIHASLASNGRDPGAFGVRAHAPIVWRDKRTPDLAATLAGLPALAEAGATVASFALAAFASSREAVRPFLEQLARGGA